LTVGISDVLNEVKAVKERGDWLTPLLMEALCKRETRTVRPDMWLGPSTITGDAFCPRAWTIAYRLGLPLVDDLAPDNRWWMDFGTAGHTMMQDHWLGPAKLIKGGWRCQRCLHTVGIDPEDKTEVFSHGDPVIDKVTAASAVHYPEGPCPMCGMEPTWREGWTFVEPTAYDTEHLIAGWSDGIVTIPGAPDEVVDFKFVLSVAWKRKAPAKEHVSQVSLYGDMLGIKRGRLFYVERGKKHLMEAIVEHPFDIDPKVVAAEKEKVRVFREAVQAPKEEPSLPDCPNGGEGTYGPCPCRDLEAVWQAHGPRPGS
jgi:hypothetical protein